MEKGWRLSDYCEQFKNPNDVRPPLTDKGIKVAIKNLKDSNYPKPLDCPSDCPEVRPACKLGICKIAICLAGDW